jgi:hypothetical protein
VSFQDRERQLESNGSMQLPREAVKLVYTNYRGETSVRLVVPERFWYGESVYHSGLQWFMDALDIEKDARRSFALRDVRCWLEELTRVPS